MSSIIAQCIYCTEENNKLDIVKECLNSLADTVDLSKHTHYIINNSQYRPAIDFLNDWYTKHPCVLFHNERNLGTAGGINLALTRRLTGQVCIKTDDDLTWGQSGWVEELADAISERPEIGILGLKRDDVYGKFVEEGKLLWSHDIFGTCTAYNPAMLDKVGYLFSPGVYGFDDCYISVRSEAAGFRNAFLPHIKITNLDLVSTPYTDWKKKEAGEFLSEAAIYMGMVRKGELSYYYSPFGC